MPDLHFLFIHGTFGRADDWHDVEKLLRNKTNYTTSAITLPGHGNRPLKETTPVLDQMVEALRQELTQPSVLVGYSLGGRISLHALEREGSALPIQALALEGAHPGIQDPAQRAERAALDSQRAERIRTQGLAAFLDRWYQLPLFGLAPDDHIARRQMVQQRADHADPDAIARILEALSPGRIAPQWHTVEASPHPLLFLHGEHDTKYAEVGHALRNVQPRTTIATIPNTHHNAHHHAPEAFVDALIAWAQKL